MLIQLITCITSLKYHQLDQTRFIKRKLKKKYKKTKKTQKHKNASTPPSLYSLIVDDFEVLLEEFLNLLECVRGGGGGGKNGIFFKKKKKP